MSGIAGTPTLLFTLNPFTADIHFANPGFFYLLLLIPAMIWYYRLRRDRSVSRITFSTSLPFLSAPRSWKERLMHLPFILRLLVIGFLSIALARPQSSSSRQNITSEGIDIVLAMDISGSMLAEDFKPNRIEAAKRVAEAFINGRPNDRIGLVTFSGESFSQCPVTTDHTVLKNLLGEVKSGMLQDGTAIGMGLATAINRLKDSQAKSKVIILLTDGVNNAGYVAPVTAADIAKTYGIRVYCIGVGAIGTAPYPFPTPFGIRYQQVEVQIDEEVLKEIAKITDGHYYRATNNNKLKEIYAEIDTLEKTRIEVTEFRRHTEEFAGFALLAGLLLCSELILRYLILKTIP